LKVAVRGPGPKGFGDGHVPGRVPPPSDGDSVDDDESMLALTQRMAALTRRLDGLLRKARGEAAPEPRPRPEPPAAEAWHGDATLLRDARSGEVWVTLEMGVAPEDLRVEASARSVLVDAGPRLRPVRVALPVRIDPTRARATYRNGVLDVALREATRPDDPSPGVADLQAPEAC
jgi:HSP20 family molecular chaperone IbpA